jgi:hypothetical protein
MVRRLLDASLFGAIVAVAAAVFFVMSADSHVAPRPSPSSSSGHVTHSTPTLAELASGSAPVPRSRLSRWPSAPDYGAIVSARIVVHDSLRERDWRRKSYGALLGTKVLLTMHPMAQGRCAWLVNRTYDELHDFMDAYRGENWAPMFTVVRHDPPVTVCRAPRQARVTTKLTS